MKIYNVIYEKCYLFSDKIAIKIKDRILSYRELNEKALQLASVLKSHGANNEPIAIVGQRKLSSYLGIISALYAGCHYIPINTKYSKSKVLSILKDAKVRFLIGDSTAFAKIALSEYEIQDLKIEYLFVPEGFSSESTDDALTFIESIDNIEVMEKPIENPLNELAYIMYTSGSTGIPKGVMVSHANLSSWIENMSKIYKLEVGFKASQTYDLSFDLSVADIFFTWVNGGVLCVLPEDEHLMPFEYIKREKIEFWSSVPTQISFLNKMGLLTKDIFPNLKYSIFCGEPLPKYLADSWKIAAPNSTVENLYGPTEATIWLTRYIYTKDEQGKSFKNNILPIGTCFEDHRIEIIDESENIVPECHVGEIVYKGPQISSGYINDTEKTRLSFKSFSWDPSKEIWYKSGDLGFYNNEGILECIGRKDSQIKMAGRRIEIGEIESILRSFEELNDLVIIPVKDLNGIVTKLVGFTSMPFNKQQEKLIRTKSEDKLERIFFPKKIIYIDTMPITPSGKIDRNKLKELASNQ